MFQHHGAFWFDASIRFDETNLAGAFRKAVDSQGLVMFHRSVHSIYGVTAERLYDYLPADIELLKTIETRGGGAILMYNTRWMFHNVLWPLWLCALEQNCFDPPGDFLECNLPMLKYWDQFAGCHRYDMSVLAILLLNAFDYEPESYAFHRIYNIKRKVTNYFSINTGCSGH